MVEPGPERDPGKPMQPGQGGHDARIPATAAQVKGRRFQPMDCATLVSKSHGSRAEPPAVPCHGQRPKGPWPPASAHTRTRWSGRGPVDSPVATRVRHPRLRPPPRWPGGARRTKRTAKRRSPMAPITPALPTGLLVDGAVRRAPGESSLRGFRSDRSPPTCGHPRSRQGRCGRSTPPAGQPGR